MSELLFLSGSIRDGSINTKLARQAFMMAQSLGASARYVDLRDFPMDLYDGDVEADTGMPGSAQELKALFVACRGFFIASPEYNSALSPLLKNVLDWISRPHEKEEPALRAFQGKVAALAAASPGALGGLRGLVGVRSILGNVGVYVLPGQVTIPGAYEAFDAEDKLKDSVQEKGLKALVENLIDVSTRLGN